MTVVWRGWCWGVSGDDVQSMCTALQDSRGENRRPQGIEVIAPRHEPTIPRAAMPGLGPGHKRRDAHCPFQLKSEEVLLQRLRRDSPIKAHLKSRPRSCSTPRSLVSPPRANGACQVLLAGRSRATRIEKSPRATIAPQAPKTINRSDSQHQRCGKCSTLFNGARGHRPALCRIPPGLVRRQTIPASG